MAIFISFKEVFKGGRSLTTLLAAGTNKSLFFDAFSKSLVFDALHLIPSAMV